MAKSKKPKFYAYFVPSSRKSGVADNWPAAEKMVKGVTGARFKAFESRAEAERWLAGGAMYEQKENGNGKMEKGKRAAALEPGIYFDAGTGRGEGVEISVTDEAGKNLLHKVFKKGELNKFGKHLVGGGNRGSSVGSRAAATNNYGELLALRYALEIAKKMRLTDGARARRIFGDSKLVIEYWSQWRIKRKELPEETVELATKVAKLRTEFEADGGAIERISGGANPADLGFHR